MNRIDLGGAGHGPAYIYRPSIHGHGGACTSWPALQCATTAAPAAVFWLALAGRPWIIYACIRSYHEARMHRAHNAIQPPLRHHRPAGPAGRRCPSEIEKPDRIYTPRTHDRLPVIMSRDLISLQIDAVHPSPWDTVITDDNPNFFCSIYTTSLIFLFGHTSDLLLKHQNKTLTIYVQNS
jgi:hypothetical protein